MSIFAWLMPKTQDVTDITNEITRKNNEIESLERQLNDALRTIVDLEIILEEAEIKTFTDRGGTIRRLNDA